MLKNEGKKSYTYFSRYQSFPTYYDTVDKKYQQGRTAWLNGNTIALKYIVKRGDTYDSIALQYYGNPTLWWLITDFNRVLDPFEKPEVNTTIQIPIYSNVEFE